MKKDETKIEKACPRCKKKAKNYTRGFCHSCYTYKLRKGELQRLEIVPVPKYFIDELWHFGQIRGAWLSNPQWPQRSFLSFIWNTRGTEHFGHSTV